MTAPLQRTVEDDTAAVAQGATATENIGTAPFAGKVTAVGYIPQAAITGADNNTRKVTLINKKQDGSGTTEVAALQFNATVNGVAADEKPLTLSATAANLVVAEGDVLQWSSAHVGTGLADPGGRVRVTVNRT
jgi:hypothetical protein